MPFDLSPGLTGAYNFRDLGGLRTGDGHKVRAGALFRSDTLQALTEQDAANLVDALGVELIVDLRGGAEAVEQGRGLLARAAVCYLNAPLRDAPVTDLDPAEQTLQFYLQTLTASGAMLTNVVRFLAALAGRPAVFHCAAGKDRTGVVTALVLSLLGVQREEIVRDYLTTQQNMPRIVERFRRWPYYRDHMAAVPPQLYQTDENTIRAFLDHLDKQFNGAKGWARTRGVPDEVIDRLKAGLLQTAAP
ncbi:tyrosine-protein phosphatase [Amycolatopsis rubida]|uniref:Tyrosine-protein phosphatase n=1 Tax=Amycolatopsis rubida TaxID=112413 RepID=A0ABX0BNB6_9PSEU|nr:MULTISPECIES: tyrosine-protein phosphatase [Amycolatopsis]MYW89335.1 protein-tyrosine-phosphatase [Amycolatopsis rubida]NEC54313.1 tyrosine-protein phosphatase [Amycolatopsis rubida]OAP21084.1 Tyrosine-protein phosphatase precursor [Amycolatopsis sp. M39]